MEEFTDADLDFLSDALDTHEKQHGFGDMMGDIMMTAVCRTDEERAKWERERDAKKRQKEAAARIHRERCILLKAKIIQLKQSRAVEILGQ